MSQDKGFSVVHNKAPEKSLIVKPDNNEPSPLRWLTICNVLVGIAVIIAGCVIAADSRDNTATWIIGSVASAMFYFTLATVTEACAKYLNKKD